MSTQTSPLRDPELVELLAEEPELLAIADALVATQGQSAKIPKAVRFSWRPRARSLSFATAIVSVAVIVTLLLVWPWSEGPGLVERARAAVGQAPVLHVVTEQPSPYGWYRPVDLATGKQIPVTQRQEIWFDSSRDLKKTITTMNGTKLDELLETPEGGFTPGGPVYTCAWIAAHPIEATKARVSCNANGENGTTPRHIPEQPPSLDLALAGFVDHYRAALDSGQAKPIGSGELDGRPVHWLRIETPREDVAIDADTYKPVLVRTTSRPPVEFRVVTIDTEPYNPSLFTRPAPQTDLPAIGSVQGHAAIDLSEANTLLGGRALWLGKEWGDYRLVGVERQELLTGYGPLSDREPTHSVGVVLQYAPVDLGGGAMVEIKEAAQCEFAWGILCGRFDLWERGLLVGLPFQTSALRRDGLYIAISGLTKVADAVAFANALERLSGSR